jgi:hypothetical protein
MGVTPVEIILCAVLLASLTLIAAAVYDAWADRSALLRRHVVDKARHLVALTQIRRNALLFVATCAIASVVVYAEVVARQWGTTFDDLRDVMHFRNLVVSGAIALFGFSAAWDLVDGARLRRKVRQGQWEPPPGR